MEINYIVYLYMYHGVMKTMIDVKIMRSYDVEGYYYYALVRNNRFPNLLFGWKPFVDLSDYVGCRSTMSFRDKREIVKRVLARYGKDNIKFITPSDHVNTYGEDKR